MREIGREYRLKWANISTVFIKKRECVNISVINLIPSEGERLLISGSLKNDLPETNSAYVHLLTNYYLSDVKELSNKGFDLPQDGSLSFTVYGGRGRYADEEPYIEKQAAAAGEYKIIPYLFNGITSPDHDRIKLGGDYIFLLKYDEGSARFTLRDVTHSVYSTDPGYTDSAGISAKTVEAACKDLSNG